MEAFERGEEIEIAYCGGNDWSVDREPEWAFSIRDYRIKPKKQTGTIEKWLCKSDEGFTIRWGDDAYFDFWSGLKKVKLIDTYEVEL